MTGSEDINYALISALYASKTNGLYSDVYFPIIKYTIVQLFNRKALNNSPVYYTSQDVIDFIEEKFKIHIPLVVITKSLEKLVQRNINFVELDLMEHGTSFRIRRVWDSHEFDELGERELFFSEGLRGVEEDYKQFLERNGCYDDGVSYLQFISDNTKEVLGYFQNNDTSVIDEKYTTIIFFLEYLHKTPSKKEEFYIADQLFWASIIAGYLRSEKPLVTATEGGTVKEYFLDTAILLGMLNLSSQQREGYAAEIRDIIKASGGVMRVHPMTIEEIKYILSSVEASSAPDPGTDMAEAWTNHKLTITKLASIRLGLTSKLEKLGVQLFPILGPEECKRKARAYVGNKNVEELARERSKSPRLYNQDKFREIHDLFMDDFIRDRRKEMNSLDDIVFVTANRELIAFTKRMHPKENYMISTSQVVLELWMHNVKPADISSCALTETMARCLDQHNVRVRSKIIEVSRFFNENKGNFDPQVYQDFIKKLYQRARNVIMTVGAGSNDLEPSGGLSAQMIVDAVKADKEYADKRLEESESRFDALSDQVRVIDQSNKELSERNKLQESQIDVLTKEKTQLLSQIKAFEEQLDSNEKQAEAERVKRSEVESKVQLYGERDSLYEELEEVSAELAPLEIKRAAAFSNWQPCVLLIGGFVSLACAILIVFLSVIKKEYWMMALVGGCITLTVFFFSRANALKDKLEDRRAKAFCKWEEMDANREYRLLVEKKERIKGRINAINLALKD